MNKEDQPNKENQNRWKLLKKAHYTDSTLSFLQIVHNLQNKYRREPIFVKQEWFLTQPEMMNQGQPMDIRSIKRIIGNLKKDGVLIVGVYPEDRRRNNYTLDYDKIAQRAVQPYPPKKTRTHKSKTVSCNHENANNRISLCLCKPCLLELSNKLPELLNHYGISGDTFVGHVNVAANDCSNNKLTGTSVVPETRSRQDGAINKGTRMSPIATNQVIDNEIVNSFSAVNETLSGVPVATEKGTRMSPNHDTHVPYSMTPMSPNSGHGCPLISPEKSAQIIEANEVAAEEKSPTKVFTKVITKDNLYDRASHNQSGHDLNASTNPEAVNLSSSVNESTTTASVEVGSSFMGSRPSSQDARQSSTVAAGEAKGTSIGHPHRGIVKTEMSAEEREQYEQLMQSNPRMVEIQHRMRAILNKNKQAATA